MTTPTTPGPFYDHKGVAHDTMPIGEDTGLPLYRAPAQPISGPCDPLPGFVPAFVRLDGAIFDGTPPISHHKVSNGPSMHIDLMGRHVRSAQPIADVSAPTDEPIMLNGLPVENIQLDWVCSLLTSETIFNGSDLLQAFNKLVAFYVAARAAAPVSGPTERLLADKIRSIDPIEFVDPAAPVSGQGASIKHDAQFCALVFTYMASGGVGAEGKRSFNALVQHIDSRPRSEDSRAAALEEAAEACENLVESIGDAAAYDQREMYDTELERMHTAMACAAAIRALASTTPQKADNE